MNHLRLWDCSLAFGMIVNCSTSKLAAASGAFAVPTSAKSNSFHRTQLWAGCYGEYGAMRPAPLLWMGCVMGFVLPGGFYHLLAKRAKGDGQALISHRQSVTERAQHLSVPMVRWISALRTAWHSVADLRRQPSGFRHPCPSPPYRVEQRQGGTQPALTCVSQHLC